MFVTCMANSLVGCDICKYTSFLQGTDVYKFIGCLIHESSNLIEYSYILLVKITNWDIL